MRLPPLHYDWVGKYLPEMHDLSRSALAPLSVDELLASRSTVEFDRISDLIGKAARVAMHAMNLWDRCGQRVFAVGPRMAEAFRTTDLSGVSTQWIGRPAHCYYVALPDCPWEIWGGTKWHRLGGFYVQHFDDRPDSPDGGAGIRFLMWGIPNSAASKIDDAMYWFTIGTDNKVSTADLEQRFGCQRGVMVARRACRVGTLG